MPNKTGRRSARAVEGCESSESKVRAELRRLSSSDGWIKSSCGSSANSSRSLTPSVQESQNKPKKRGRPKNSKNKIKAAAKEKKEKKRGRPRIHDKPKQFKMVLEEDDDYEVDYLSPEEDDDLVSNYSEDQKEEVASLSDDNTSIADDISLGGISSIRPYFEEEFDDDDENIPELVLPPSSDDLLISNEQLLPALQVYEVLRHFRTVLRLSPMLFEDFCAALISSETSIIMSECHMVLLKALLKEDDQNNVLFVPPDQKETSNSYFYFIDHITWPEVLKYYIKSYKEYQEVERILEHPDFPLVEVEQRITVLQLLTDLFISSTKIRDQLMMDGTIQYDDHCRACHKLGDLLCCETCSAVYHLVCTNPPLKDVPEEEWHCELCVNHKLNGLTNCETDEEWFGQYLRHDIIGTDRHSRKYWFLARRIIVESEDEVRYYSTNEEFQYLLTILDPERYEVVLGEAMKNIMSEFPLQSKITEQITNNVVEDQKHKGGSCLNLIKERTRKMIEEEDRKREELEERQREEEEHRYNMTMEEKILKEEEAKNNEDDEPMQDDPPPLPVDPDKVKAEEDSSTAAANQTAEVNGAEGASNATLKTSNSQELVVKTEPDSADLSTVPSTSTVKPPQSNVQKMSFSMPTSSVAASSNPSTLQLLKAGQKIHVPTGGNMSLKNLYVVKDGVKTPLAVSGKIISSPKIVFVNQNKQKSESSEIRKVQFTGSGQSVPMLISPVSLSSQAQDNNRQMEAGNLNDSIDEDPFRLGEDEGYKHYVNQYTEHPLAQNKYQLKESKDRDRHIGNRFSLTGSGAFNWDDPVHGDKEKIVNTLRSMLFRFEEQVPLCFMHSKWEQYRKMWARMLIKNNSQKAMSIVLGILEQAIRDNVKKPTWKEYMGCVTMRRLVTEKKEEYDKKKKLKSKQQEDKIQKSATWCKYPLVTISSNLCKLKGEDYRVSGFGGWYWRSNTAQFPGKKYVPKVSKEVEKPDIKPEIKQETTEKPKSPAKEIVTMKSDADVTADVIAAASAADDQQEEEQSKEETVATEEEKNKEATVIDVAASLLDRSNGMYTKTWAPSRVDKLLKLRQAHEAVIKAEKEKEAEKKDAEKKEGDKEGDKKEESEKKPTPPPPRIAFTPSGKGSYSKSAKNEQKSETYPISRRYSKIQQRTRKRSQITEGLDDTCKVWKLKKPKETLKMKTVQMPLPWKFCARKGRKKSIFRLPLSDLRPLICRGGCTWTPRCFHQSWKNPNYLDLYWPYPAPRPTISTSWRYKIQSATSYASIAYSLRLLWHSIRWEDMAMKPTNADAVHAVHNDDSIVTTELMKRRDVGLSGLRQEYYIRRIVMPVGEQEQEIPRSETYTPSSRSGLRTRNRPIAFRDRTHRKTIEIPSNKPKVENLWLPEQHIELWQIRQFDLALREERKKQKKKYTAIQGPPQVIDAKTFKAFHSNSTIQTKQLKISQPLLQQANALSKQQIDSLTFTPPGDSIKISTAGMQNSVIKVSEGIVTNNKQPVLQKITIKAPIQPHYVRTASGNLIQTTPLLQSRGSQIILANGNRVLPKPIIIKQGPGGVITANARSLHPTVKLPGPSYKGQAIQVQQNPNNQQKSTGQQFPMATIPTRPIAKLQQQYQQKQMQQKQQQTTTNMQVKLSSSQLNQLMKADNDAVVKVSLKFSNGDPGTGQMQVIPPNKPVFPAPGQQLMQCKVGNEVRKFLLTAGPPVSEQPTITHVPTITTMPTQFPVLAATSVMTPVSPANNEVSVTAPSLRDRLEQLQQRTPDLLKQPFTDGLRLMSDKDPLWSGSALAARSALPADNNKLNSGNNNAGGGSFSSGRKHNRESRGGSGHHHLNHHAHSSDHSKSSRGSSVRKRPMVSRDQREEMQRKNSVQQLMKSMLDKVERAEEMEVKRKRKEKLAEQQRRKRESIDEARSHQRLQSRLTLALKRHEEMVKQEIRKRQIITEKYMTKIVENQLFDDTVVQRRNKASAAAAAAEMRSRREKRKLQDAATASFTSSAPSSSSSRAAKRPRAGMVHTSAKQPTTTSHHRPSVAEKRAADHHHRAGSSSSTSRKHHRTTSSGATKRTFNRPATPPPIERRRSPSPPPVVTKKKKMISTSEQLYCICLTPYDESKFYIGCDLCTNWFHADCVGITKRMAKVMDTWVCPDCKKVKPQEELYCLCKTPYDDSKFYIGCDACQDWFHGTCVGLAEDQASAIESYTCPRCRQEQKDASNEEQLNTRDYLNLGKIMRHLKNHKMSWPFLQPVRESDAPGYYKVVKRPMDLSTVIKRLECKYYRKLSALVGDVSLIFDNCRQYNGAASPMVRCAEIVETEFVGKIRDLRGRR